jgi:hypothetical protein
VRTQRPIKGTAYARIVFHNQHPHRYIVPDVRGV